MASPLRLAGWLLLAALLTATLVGALTFHRAGWPQMVGDEATYAMQADSLAHDLDLSYSRRDYDRFVDHWGKPPEGLILQTRDGGRHLVYGKPFLYALAVAPFARLAPVRGPVVANVLFLALAAVLAALTLEQRLGDAAPLWVAVFLFASVAFAYVFWIHADLFLLAATAAGYALVYRGEHPAEARLEDLYQPGDLEVPGWRFAARWAGAGALLGTVVAFRPFYLPLLVPAALAVPPRRRTRALAALAAGVLAVVALSAGVQWASGGSWSPYGGERQGFYRYTGFPDVDFPASNWEKSVERWGNTSWIHPGALDLHVDPSLLGWDALYFLVGRDVGVLPYFAPLLLGFVAFARQRGRWAIVPAVGLAVVAFLLVMPFNFYGGGGAIANRYFLPLYPALWFLAGRPVSPRRGIAWAVVVILLASPFVSPVWSSPRAFPIGPDGRYRYVSRWAARLLPYETSQSHIPGGHDTQVGGLWVKFLDDFAGPGEEGKLLLRGGGQAELLIGSPFPLDSVRLEIGRGAPSSLRVGGARMGNRTFHPDGSAAFDLLLDAPRARHAMWWTWDPVYLYRLDLELPPEVPGPVAFRLFAGASDTSRH